MVTPIPRARSGIVHGRRLVGIEIEPRQYNLAQLPHLTITGTPREGYLVAGFQIPAGRTVRVCLAGPTLQGIFGRMAGPQQLIAVRNLLALSEARNPWLIANNFNLEPALQCGFASGYEEARIGFQLDTREGGILSLKINITFLTPDGGFIGSVALAHSSTLNYLPAIDSSLVIEAPREDLMAILEHEEEARPKTTAEMGFGWCVAAGLNPHEKG